jgi:aldose 1-epimerase
VLGPDFTVTLAFEARLSGEHPCPVSLTNHAYFQLDGQPIDVRRQHLCVEADAFLPVDAHGLPLGGPAPVQGTRFDFRRDRRIDGALDHAFLLKGDVRLCATDRLVTLTLSATMPALQVYTGDFLAQGTGERWPCFSGIALEPGWLPDSPRHAEWPQPDCWLAPGQVWQHRIAYRFQTDARKLQRTPARLS